MEQMPMEKTPTSEELANIENIAFEDSPVSPEARKLENGMSIVTEAMTGAAENPEISAKIEELIPENDKEIKG